MLLPKSVWLAVMWSGMWLPNVVQPGFSPDCSQYTLVYSRSWNSAKVIEIDGNNGPHNRLSENPVMAVMGSLVPSLSPRMMHGMAMQSYSLSLRIAPFHSGVEAHEYHILLSLCSKTLGREGRDRGWHKLWVSYPHCLSGSTVYIQ